MLEKNSGDDSEFKRGAFIFRRRLTLRKKASTQQLNSIKCLAYHISSASCPCLLQRHVISCLHRCTSCLASYAHTPHYHFYLWKPAPPSLFYCCRLHCNDHNYHRGAPSHRQTTKTGRKSKKWSVCQFGSNHKDRWMHRRSHSWREKNRRKSQTLDPH